MPDRNDQPSNLLPDLYDKVLDELSGARGTLSTKPATLQVVPWGGVGGSVTYIVRSFRTAVPDARDETKSKPQFYVTLQVTSREPPVRLVLPPKVADLIARQRDSLTSQARKRLAKAQAKTRQAKGFVPFQKKAAS